MISTSGPLDENTILEIGRRDRRIAELEAIVAAIRAAILDPALEDADCCDKIRDILDSK